MAVEILANRRQYLRARSEMRRRGLDFTSHWPARLLRKVGLAQGVDVGDVRKSWDVIKTADFLVDRVPRGAPILDIGGYASEILCVLHKLNFSDLTGIDLDPRLDRMPCGNAIKYMSGDFTQTQFETETFSAITAISVLEHGYCGPKVFNEISRLLKVGGYLISSVDYWPEKIDTSGIRVFGLDWRIFSKDEVMDLIAEAANVGMVPVGPLRLEASNPTIKWRDKKYTFAWLALQKVGSTARL